MYIYTYICTDNGVTDNLQSQCWPFECWNSFPFYRLVKEYIWSITIHRSQSCHTIADQCEYTIYTYQTEITTTSTKIMNPDPAAITAYIQKLVMFSSETNQIRETYKKLGAHFKIKESNYENKTVGWPIVYLYEERVRYDNKTYQINAYGVNTCYTHMHLHSSISYPSGVDPYRSDYLTKVAVCSLMTCDSPATQQRWAYKHGGVRYMQCLSPWQIA